MKRFFSGFFLRAAFLVLAAAALPAVGIVFFTAVERNADSLSGAEARAMETVDSLAQLLQSFALHAAGLIKAVESAGGIGVETLTSAERGLVLPRGGPAAAGTFFFADAKSLLGEEEADGAGVSAENAPALPAFVAGSNLYCDDEDTACSFFGLKVAGPKGPIVVVKVSDLKTSRFLSEKVLESPGAKLRMMDMAGRRVVTYPSGVGGDEEELQRLRKELAARPNAQGSFYMEDGEQRSLVSYRRLRLDEDEPQAYAQVVLVTPESGIQSKVEAMQRKDLFLLCLAIGGVIVLSLLIVYLLLFPTFRRVLTVARAYAEGDFSMRVPLKQPVREFGELAESMNSMADAIEKREGELIKARELAEFSGKNKGEFLATMSHEIRTPMNAIIGMAYLALKSELTVRQRGYLTKIYDAASALLKVINDILELSKLDAGKLRMELVPFAMRDIVVEVRRHVAMEAQEKGLDLNFTVAPDVPRYLMGDPVHLSQVLGHLLENGVRITQKGSVSLSCELERMAGENAILRLRVQDTGPGMSPERLAFLKSLFSGKEEASAESASENTTGLGLLLVCRLLQAMKGEMELESAPGKGTVFSMTIPFGQRPESKGAKETLLSGLRVLAVDDDPLALETFRQLLDSFGMETTVLSNPEEALAVLEEAHRAGEPYHLVVLDWRMPQIDGLEAARRIRANKAFRRSPAVILFSAYGWEGLTLQAESAGIDAFLHKPVNESVLLDTILTLLQPDAGQYYLRGGSLDGADSKDLKGISVLVVDDNSVNQEVARELLEDAGMMVTLANNGLEAFELISLAAGNPDPPFDMVLMDVQMPVMNGLEACRSIRALTAPWASDLPVIAMTVHGRSSEKDEFAKSGFDGHVSKPISVEELFSCVKRWRPVAPVNDPAVASRMRLLHDDLCRGSSSWQEAFSSVEFMLGLHLHEGRFNKLSTMLHAGETAAAADFLGRLNATLGFK